MPREREIPWWEWLLRYAGGLVVGGVAYEYGYGKVVALVAVVYLLMKSWRKR